MRPGVGEGVGDCDGVGEGDSVVSADTVGEGVGVTVTTGAHALATTSATRSPLTELP